ncbi:MAG: flavin reductase [Christensenellaceae bacterium]|jgi:flavin reductase (DIM6/NTAB) family NADH-FMN oxidoreductase RutF
MMKEIAIADFNGNAFESIGGNGMLIAAEKGGKANAMLAKWGGLGFMWGKNIAIAVIRPSRYTKEFVDAAEQFSLSFPPAERFGKQLTYFGTVSGRDEDKIEKSGMKIAYMNGIPYFEEAETVILCKSLYMQPFEETCFIDGSLIERWYPKRDFHIMYMAEIEKILIAE